MFILVTAAIVLGTGLWPDTQQAILVLLALAGAFLILVNDVLPSNALGSAKFVVEGSVALTGAAMLVALTNGIESPFFFTFPLVDRGRGAGRPAGDHHRDARDRRPSGT